MFESDLIKGLLAVGIGIFSVFSAWFIGNNVGKNKIKTENNERDFKSMQDVAERTESIVDADRDEYAKRLHNSTR